MLTIYKKLYYVYIMIYIDRKRFLMEKMMNYTLSTNRVLFLCADQYFFFGEADPWSILVNFTIKYIWLIYYFILYWMQEAFKNRLCRHSR